MFIFYHEISIYEATYVPCCSDWVDILQFESIIFLWIFVGVLLDVITLKAIGLQNQYQKLAMIKMFIHQHIPLNQVKSKSTNNILGKLQLINCELTNSTHIWTNFT